MYWPTREEELAKMRELIDKLNYYTKCYDEGNPQITDSEWDKMYFELQLLERDTGVYHSDSPTQCVHYELKSELEKVTHSSPMLSLDKTKDWDEFIRYFGKYDYSKSVVGMLKLDGLTCRLTYENGELVQAETRGDGYVGEGVLHNALVIKSIPKKIDYKETLIIDGEVICTYANFEPFKEEYANPRNFTAGSIRLLDSAECAKRNLDFIAWNVVTEHHYRVTDNFTDLTRLGFRVTPWTSSWDWDAKEFLVERAKEEGLPIDGLVGRFNDIEYGKSLGATGHHSRAAYAFKFADEVYETHLLDIEWTMGRTGVLTPTAVFEPIDTGDSCVERASLHNITIMEELLGKYPHKGQPIEIYKANMIIPQVYDAECKEYQGYQYHQEHPIFAIPTVCPICGGATECRTDVASTILYCANDECSGKLITKIDHFASKKGLDIKGLSRATLEKLIDWGWVEKTFDIYQLNKYRDEWIQKSGFGQKSVDNVLAAIEESRKPKLDKFIAAIGIPMIGNTLAKEIVKYFDSYEAFRSAVNNKYDFTVIDKIAVEKCASIWNFNYAEADLLASYMLAFETDNTSTANQTLEGSKIVVTGTLQLYKNRGELQAAIEARGGKVISSVSKNTTLLINNNPSSSSSKNITAQRLGVPILTEQEFYNLYLDN